ncbi:MAG: hypothetical protein AB7O92_18145 [Acidimicrobiia bacterium]
MTVLTVVSAKGSPGATTIGLLLASAGDPVRLPLLLEADPAGGDLGAQLGTLFEPGMATLVEEARWEGEGIRRRLDAFCRVLPTGAGVIVGSVQPKQVATYVDDAPALLGAHLRARGGLAIVDAGRWGSESAARWAQHSDALVVAVRPTVDNAEHVAVRLGPMAEVVGHVHAVMIDQGPLSAADVAEVLEWPVTALPADADAVRRLAAGRLDHHELRHLPIGRAAAALLEALLDACAAVDRPR